MLKNLMKAARESIEGEVAAVTPEEQEAGMQDTSLTADIIDEVQAPAGDIEQGMADITAAEVEADSLDTTAAALNETLADGGTGADPVAAELAANQIQAAAERFYVAVAARPAKEAYSTSAGRREATMSLAREAEDASKSLREQVSAAIAKAIEWLKSLVASVLDKAVRLENRAKALLAKAKAAPGVGGGKEVKMNIGFLGTESAVAVAAKLAKGASAFDELAKLASKDAKDMTVDLNPGELGGLVLKAVVDAEGKVELTKETNANGPKTGSSLATSAVVAVATSVLEAAGKIKAAKAAFNKINSDLNGLVGAIKNANGAETGRAAAVSKSRAVTGAAGSLSSMLMRTASGLLDLCDKSLSANAAKVTQAEAKPAAA